MALRVCQSIDSPCLIRYKHTNMKRTRILFPILAVMLAVISCRSPFAARTVTTPIPLETPTLQTPPAPTATATLPPTPTPPPAVRVEQGEQALFLGNYDRAWREFVDAQNNTADPAIKAAAALGVGRSLYLARNYSTAIQTLEDMLTAYPDSADAASAYYFLARSYEESDLYELAANAYAKYIELRPGTLDWYMQERRGDAWSSAGNPAMAVEAYSAAIAAPQDRSTIWIQLKLGKAYAALGDFTNAITTYLSVYEASDNEYARAQANFLLGQAYMTMDMPEQAYARYLDSVGNFPRAYDTYAGLVQLVTDGVPVDDLQRGIVDYYAGEYGLAIEALSRAIDTGTNSPAQAYHFRALSKQALNQPVEAIADWDFIIANYAGDTLWGTAWEEKGYTQWAYLDKYDEGAATLLGFVEQNPALTSAPEFLFQAARIQERGGRLTEAAATWERLMDTYPAAENAYRGLFLAGISYYRAADYARALTVFQRVLLLATTPTDQAAAQLWIGKTQLVLGDAEAARAAWEQGVQSDPTGYYSYRANELLQNRAPFAQEQPVDYGYDLNSERAQAETWLRSTFALTPETDLSGVGALAGDPRFQRGMAFWELGLYGEGRNEFETLRQSVISSPASTYVLMNHFLSIGLYRPAVLSSRQVLDLANMDDVGTLQAPVYFNHIRYGIYFRDLVMSTSQSENLHPLFLLSVMRQESMFEGFAQSGAGARGLMQIMPATGREIVSSMGWPVDYIDDDLYRPEVSIVLGGRYLSRQRDYFSGNLFAALAAYNGGPGNTIIWQQLAGDDPDLLLEVIRANETRQYIMYIYEYFNIYQMLYERGM